MRVVVAGAGVTGLVAAYLLESAGISVVVVERSNRLGGNALTHRVRVGDQVRWVDLGVNDFNAATYPRLTALLAALGVEHRPLDDSASFFTRDGSVCFTLDGRWSTAMPAALAAEYEQFQARSRADFDEDPACRELTVGQYLAARGFSRDLADLIVNPRVSAMYFANDVDPAAMPFGAAMSYYRRQEGTTVGGTDRRYFAHGSASWIGALAARIRGPIHLDAELCIDSAGRSVRARIGDGEQRFDAAVLCCPPADILTMVTTGLDTETVRSLGSFSYSNSIAVAHSHPGVLPPDANAWRTYNVTIRGDQPGLRPYSMTYVENRHQNDARNERYKRVGTTPQIFVTINPLVPIPESTVLRNESGQPAIAQFRHTVIDFAALSAQQRLRKIQGRHGIYLAGGWLKDVGLHESCIESAYAAVDRLVADFSTADAQIAG